MSYKIIATTLTIQEFQAASIQTLRTNFILLSIMHKKSTNPKEKEYLNNLMAKAITVYYEGDPIPTLLRNTHISPIWIPESEAEKEAVADFMAQQMTSLNEAAFIAFAQQNILNQTLQAASDKKGPVPQQELDIKTLYNKVNFTIVSQILSHPSRNSRLETFRLFEHIMNRHLKEGDFASAFQIYTALTHSSVQRLSSIKAHVESDMATGCKQAEEIFNPRKNFSALNAKMKEYHNYIPMIPQWFGHIESAVTASEQKGAQTLDTERLFTPLIKQQEHLRETYKLDPCTENIQGLFSNVLKIIQNTDASPEIVMQETSEALTKLSHTMENPEKSLPYKKHTQAEIDFKYTETKKKIALMSASSTPSPSISTPPLMEKTISKVLSGIWTNNPVYKDWDEESELL